jgi:N-acetylmuramoyl-L-alanine amidase
MTISNHKLIDNDGHAVAYQKSPNTKGPFTVAGAPDTIIIHFTAGANAQSSIATLCDDKTKARVSAHLVVGRDKSITQLVPFNQDAWHAGPSSWGGRESFNKFSIGIEIDNAGPLTKQGSEYFTWFHKSVPVAEVFEGKHRNQNTLSYWQRYTEWQIDKVQEICAALIQEYDIKYILGHEEISPKIKVDPGPAFPLDKMRERLLTSNRADDGPAEKPEEPLKSTEIQSGIVAVEKLNIRSGAGSSNPLVSSPLPYNTPLTVLAESNGWYKVQTKIEGWVYKDYVRIQPKQ